MPIRLLFWNIQNFSVNKIDRAAYAAALRRRQYQPQRIIDPELKRENILRTVQETAPAIFVVIEVMGDRGTKGSLLASSGADGTICLLSHLRHRLGQAWCAVPPLKLLNRLSTEELDADTKAIFGENTVTEGISVFFRSDLLDFVGPYVWPRTNNNEDPDKVAVPFQDGLATQDYPGIWQWCLPAGNHYAGQCDFRQQGYEFLFTADNHRRPWLTRFVERGVANPRTFSVVSVHLPPQADKASASLDQVGRVFGGGNYPLGDREVLVVGGDVNVDANTDVDTASLGGMVGYLKSSKHMREMGFSEPLFKWPPPPDYSSTMYRKADKATPGDYVSRKLLDNVFLRYGQNAHPQQLIPTLIVDRVEGGTPLGNVHLTSDMARSLTDLRNIPDEATRNQAFRLDENYAHMGPNPGTSDHLPILFEL